MRYPVIHSGYASGACFLGAIVPRRDRPGETAKQLAALEFAAELQEYIPQTSPLPFTQIEIDVGLLFVIYTACSLIPRDTGKIKYVSDRSVNSRAWTKYTTSWSSGNQLTQVENIKSRVLPLRPSSVKGCGKRVDLSRI